MQADERAYRRSNIAALTISILAITLPAIILPIRLATPHLLPVCYSITILGRPCPMCGLTRGIGSIIWGRFSKAIDFNLLSYAFFTIFLLEIVFRSYLLVAKPDSDRLSTIKAYDIRTHLCLFALYLLYAVYFHLV